MYNTSTLHSIFITIVFVLTFHSISSSQNNAPVVFGHQLKERLVYITTNFVLTNDLPKLKNILQRAADNCFTGVVVSDAKFGYLNDFPENSQYQNNLNQFLEEAAQLGLTVYPAVVNFGYSTNILYHDPNLAEGLPVKDAPFVVQKVSNELVLVNDPTDQLSIKNGNFEMGSIAENTFSDWYFQDDPGQCTFIDKKEFKSGTASIRICDLDQAYNGTSRISQIVGTTPFRDYYVSVWVKTENWEKGLVQFLAIDTNSKQQLIFNPIAVTKNQGWTQYELTFNTLKSNSIQIYLGVWGGGKGTLWFDDLKIRPTTFNNIIRRDATPLSIKRPNGEALVEGVDTDPIVDPISGYDPYPGSFSIWHTQPLIKIPTTSSLKEGDKVLVSYYHTAIINGNQFCASLTEPAALDIAGNQLQEIRDILLKKGMFKGWFLGHDEIRINNWDNSPNFGSPGRNLAYNIQEIFKRAKRIDPDANLMVWSDMFDKYHNASEEVNPYYLVNGSWEDSWEGLPSEVTIFNWQYRDRINSGNFFSHNGHQQILCGFYDQPSFYTKTWLEELNGRNGVKGVMYTTWEEDYSQLENWAKDTWGECDLIATSVGTSTIKSEMILHPNPANEKVQVELKGGLNISRIMLMDTSGNIVLNQKHPPTNWIQITTKHFAAGIYILIVHTTDKKTSIYKKLTIQH